jgi:hypothetical protein
VLLGIPSGDADRLFYVNHLIDLLPGSTDTFQGLPATHFGNREDRLCWLSSTGHRRLLSPAGLGLTGSQVPSLENSTAGLLAAKLRFSPCSRSSRRPWLFCFFPLPAFADTMSEYLTTVWNTLQLRTRGPSNSRNYMFSQTTNR